MKKIDFQKSPCRLKSYPTLNKLKYVFFFNEIADFLKSGEQENSED